MAILFNDLAQTKGFSEDGEQNLLHNLIRALLMHVNSTVDEPKAIEAVKCLGEIGTYDLVTMVFKCDAETAVTYEDVSC